MVVGREDEHLDVATGQFSTHGEHLFLDSPKDTQRVRRHERDALDHVAKMCIRDRVSILDTRRVREFPSIYTVTSCLAGRVTPTS